MTRSPKASTSSTSPGMHDGGRGIFLDQRRAGDAVAGRELRALKGRRFHIAGAFGEIDRAAAAVGVRRRHRAAFCDPLERRLAQQAASRRCAATRSRPSRPAPHSRSGSRARHRSALLMPSRSCRRTARREARRRRRAPARHSACRRRGSPRCRRAPGSRARRRPGRGVPSRRISLPAPQTMRSASGVNQVLTKSRRRSATSMP